VLPSVLNSLDLLYFPTRRSSDLSSKNAKYAITFFPLDETFFFTDATTNLDNFQDNLLNWTTLSSSEKPVYLRQDVSLLYENGFFKGIQSKWEQDQQII